MARDPRPTLVRLILRLEDRGTLITFADIERASKRLRTLQEGRLQSTLDAAVDDLLVLVDHRTFFDRESATLDDRKVYRVNRRHPLVRPTLR